MDRLPSWFLRIGAPFFYKPVSRLYSINPYPNVSSSPSVEACTSLKGCLTPAGFWLSAHLHHTHVLSRTWERIIVRHFLYPAIITPPEPLDFTEHYAFRLTGSTTAAIALAIALDFSKAYDTVRYVTLLQKFGTADVVYNWLVDFFLKQKSIQDMAVQYQPCWAFLPVLFKDPASLSLCLAKINMIWYEMI